MDLAVLQRPAHRWGLRGAVAAACGAATKFHTLGHQLSRWMEAGPEHAPPATVALVEPSLAGYLDGAAAAGRRWGTRVGVAAGTAAGVLAALVTAVIR
jgi:hypothetical protein